jgi:hypothetical protein
MLACETITSISVFGLLSISIWNKSKIKDLINIRDLKGLLHRVVDEVNAIRALRLNKGNNFQGCTDA